jgi:hypothetical protein
MRIQAQIGRFLVVVVGVGIGLIFTPAVQSGPHKLISHLEASYYACAFALLTFSALWVWDFLVWMASHENSPAPIDEPNLKN